MICPKTGFGCDEPQKYQAKIILKDKVGILSEGVAEVKGSPLLFCDKCKEQVDVEVLVSDKSWIELCNTFKSLNKPIPDKSKSCIQWLKSPSLQ